MSRAESPRGSGAAHGQTTSGGVTNFTSTSSQSAWRATGPILVARQITHTVAASAVVMTTF